MKSTTLSLVLGSIFLMASSISLYAESWDVDVVSTIDVDSSIVIENPLLVESITTPDDAHIILQFNQPIIQESVRARITKQMNESNVRIESFTWGADNQSIQIILSDILEADTAYKMTVISAISDGGIIIKDGADGLKEFTTPKDLARFAPEIVLNAPNNPNAVVITATGGENTQASSGVVTEEPKLVSETAEELPLTGIDTTLFVIIASVLAFILIVRRRQV